MHPREIPTADMIRRWGQFAKDISADHGPRQKVELDSSGELLILGSGLAHIDLLLNDERSIQSADYVFHCLYDRVTQIWLNQLRPDAFDLRILYRSNLSRHDTYVCMSEAMLYHVRRGKKVVAVYYGHPGIFATPTHRALRIAREEGHRASMRPGISALDYLIADIGFDPMIPGLISYEASDMLLRRRRLDPSLHTVIWQVGAVGEFGYNPQGFANEGFNLLVHELETYYGPDTEIINYIAPQYVGVDPLIARHRVDDLKQREVQSQISAMSTFYIAPQMLAATDRDRASSLGFTISSETSSSEEQEFDISAYGSAERAALLHFEEFAPDEKYAVAGPSPAAEVMLALSREPDLLARFRKDPSAVFAEPRFSGLSGRAKKLLVIPHPLAINAAIAEPVCAEEKPTA